MSESSGAAESTAKPGADSVTVASSGPTAKPRRTSGKVVPHQPRWSHRWGAWLLQACEASLFSTVRLEWDRNNGLFLPDRLAQPVIYCLWHNRLALALWILRTGLCGHVHNGRIAALVSASRDGAFLSAVLERYGVQAVRGSSSRRGPQALLELITWAEQGYSLAITPDGPRGPRYVVQDGVIAVAQMTGLPILPVGCRFSRKWTLRSWDAFQIPKPLARCAIHFGEPMRIPRAAPEPERDALRRKLEECMRQIASD